MRSSALVAAFTALVVAVATADEPKESAPLPRANEFSKLVLEVLKSYPTDGTHKYHWPKGSTWTGTTRDLVYRGTKVGTGDPEKRCYCCGITFEVFFRAYELYCERAKKPFRILDLDGEDCVRLRREWFGPTEKDRTTLQKAIVQFKLGKAVKLEDARPGDFCQLWRHQGSGHSVIVMAVEKENGKPVALRYWSTQGSTNGIGEHTEKFTDQKPGMILAETYVARVGD